MTDNINPEYQHPPKENVTPAPAPAPEKKGNGLALLALLVAAFGTGVSVYNYQQAKKDDPNYADGQDNPVLAQLEAAVQQQAQAQKDFAKSEEVTQLAAKVAELSEKSGDNAGVDKAELEKMISNAIAASQLTPEQIAEMAGDRGVSEEKVQALINQSLTQLTEGDQKIDLSKEISEIQAIGAEAKTAAEKAQASIAKLENDKSEILQSIDDKVKGLDADLAEKSKTFAASMDQKIATLQQTIGEIDNTATNPAPLLNTLKLAQMAASNGNYIGAKSYLDQATESFTLFGLNNSPYAGFQQNVANLRSEYTNLATNPTPAAQINNVIASVGNWTFKNAAPAQKSTAPAASEEQTANEKTWLDTIKGVGQNILDNTIRVTPLDEAGLVWINANEALQNVIRENVRLDLAFARNALQLGDYASYSAMADQAQENINRYFDTSNGQVAAALDLLANLKNQNKHGAEIGDLIQSIEQTK